MTFEEFLYLPLFLFQCCSYSREIDKLVQYLTEYPEQFEIYVESQNYISFTDKKSRYRINLSICSRDSLCNFIYFYAWNKKYKLFQYKHYYHGSPKRITVIRFWLKYRTLIKNSIKEIKQREKSERFHDLYKCLDELSKDSFKDTSYQKYDIKTFLLGDCYVCH